MFDSRPEPRKGPGRRHLRGLGLIAATAVLLALMIMSAPVSTWAESADVDEVEYFRALVLSVSEPVFEDIGYGMIIITQDVRLRVTSGAFRGLEIDVQHSNPNDPAYEIPVRAGGDVIISAVVDGTTLHDVYIESLARDRHLFLLGGIFLVSLVAIGGLKGLRAAVTLGITLFAIVRFMLPALLRGSNPVIVSVLVAIGAATVTLTAIGGIRNKTLAAIAGTTGGVVVAGLLAAGVGAAASLTGLGPEETRMLMYIPQEVKFDFRGLMFAGMLIGALGAVMDVGMSVASAMEEIRRVKPDLPAAHLWAAGMNVGRDIMGTMANTLVLAYTGSAIPLLLLFMAYEMPLLRLLSYDLVATEVVRALTGSVGLVMAIPITAAVGCLLLPGSRRTPGSTAERPAGTVD